MLTSFNKKVLLLLGFKLYKEHQTIKEISPPFHEYRKEGKHATPHHNNTNDQCPSLVTNQLAKLERGNQHLCLSRKRDLRWVMRVKELKHAKRSEQLFAQGQAMGDSGVMFQWPSMWKTLQELCGAQSTP